MNVTDRQTDGPATANSEREREFTFAKNLGINTCTVNCESHSNDRKKSKYRVNNHQVNTLLLKGLK